MGIAGPSDRMLSSIALLLSHHNIGSSNIAEMPRKSLCLVCYCYRVIIAEEKRGAALEAYCPSGKDLASSFAVIKIRDGLADNGIGSLTEESFCFCRYSPDSSGATSEGQDEHPPQYFVLFVTIYRQD